jgi:hypothetical protein
VSSTRFPTFPALKIEQMREIIHAVKVDTGESQVEVRTIWTSSPRYRYSVRLTARKDTPVGNVETAQLQTFINDMYGAWDSFYWPDSYEAGSPDRLVRFEQPPTMRQVYPGWWECDLVMISVLEEP